MGIRWETTGKKRQFSKMHVAFADFLVLFVYVVSAVLSWYERQPLSDIALGIITVYGAFATGGYFTLCAVRDCSLNKRDIALYEKGDNE